MKNHSVVKQKNIILAALLPVFVLIYLFKTNTDLFVHSDYCFPPNQTEIELLLPEYQDSQSDFGFYSPTVKQLTTANSPGVNPFYTNKKALLFFNNYVNQQFKFYKCTFFSSNSSRSFLRKTIPCYPSSDDYPLLVC